MKRVVPPGAGTAEPPASRRRRALSAEERALWHVVADSTKPLKKRPRLTRVAAPETTKDAGKTASVTPPPAAGKREIATATVPARRPEPPPLIGIARRERLQLSRARKDIDARLDLHGMTQARAHRVLLHFLQQASEEGLSFVLVITGKGRVGEASERGVLRRQVPEWLSLPEFRGCVAGFEEAHVGHGGGGALYVRIRRPRRR